LRERVNLSSLSNCGVVVCKLYFIGVLWVHGCSLECSFLSLEVMVWRFGCPFHTSSEVQSWHSATFGWGLGAWSVEPSLWVAPRRAVTRSALVDVGAALQFFGVY
jgi:hypothetical protein